MISYLGIRILTSPVGCRRWGSGLPKHHHIRMLTSPRRQHRCVNSASRAPPGRHVFIEDPTSDSGGCSVPDTHRLSVFPAALIVHSLINLARQRLTSPPGLVSMVAANREAAEGAALDFAADAWHGTVGTGSANSCDPYSADHDRGGR